MSNEPNASENDLVIEFGREIRRRREAKGWTLEQLSERAGITPNYIGTIENGKRDPSISTLHSIASGLGIPLSELLGSRRELSPWAMELARLFDQVIGEIQASMLLLLRSASKIRRK